MAWIHDVRVVSDVQRGNPIGTTGGHVWDAAVRLVEFLEAMQGELNLKRDGLRIMELGAGTGFLAMTVARNLPNACVCATEMGFGGALEHLTFNVEENRASVPLGNLSVAACDWSLWCGEDGGGEGGGESLRHEEWDMIIGSDLIYNDAGVKMLPQVLKGLLSGGKTVAYYCHTKHRFDMMDQDFVENVTKAGLFLEEIVEDGREMPPESPPLYETLFGEMRIAVWRIQAADGGGAGNEFVRAKYVPKEDEG